MSKKKHSSASSSRAQTPGSKNRSKSSKRWLREHFDDTYVKQAQKQGYRSRAVFKLLEIHEKDRLFRRNMVIVDLGASPGGWSQLANKLTGNSAQIVALDLLNMDPLPGVTFIQGDFTEQSVLDALLNSLKNEKVDLVMSDMAPNISGIKAVDQPRAMYLAELALDLAQNVLRDGGELLIKVFQGTDFDTFFKTLRDNFDRVVTRKPKASKSNSREVYLLARGFRGKADT